MLTRAKTTSKPETRNEKSDRTTTNMAAKQMATTLDDL